MTGEHSPTLHSSSAAYDRVLASPPSALPIRSDLLRSDDIIAAARAYCPPLFDPLPCDAFVAGGFVRDTVARTAPRDLDLYGPDSAAVSEIEMRLRAAGWLHCGSNLVMSTWQDRWLRTVQVIRTERASAEACIARFDLTICCAALDLRDMTAWCADSFLTDVYDRRLVIHSPAFPIDTLRRVARFLAEGYSISARQLQILHSRILGELHANGIHAFRPDELIAHPLPDTGQAA